ncbi:glycosyltransferase family 4 protein [Faecalibacterium prausnitzii]|uniref:glycosyltransferase family 4 protein n=1 Tax=Faecalibacterium prausnitzii TaxID=853 RepID=UPI001C2BE680|nr:glycosyltransferase family 4 protein [Faecalibacterium prausnitzii]MBV0896379.1 glycosyltransferase family 4 protein [Faecalibacterium prausnitzii]MCQ5161386.1 glycosyltransferase family 4 protein [Faecalibacterium prausnitzii]MCQ5175146.1 glycosyltransferase family 4 protein [Faecalibacterium prausnitzii]
MKHTVAFLIQNMNGKGGTERVTSVVANGLSKKGYTIYIISCCEGERSCYFVNSSVKLLSLHSEGSNNLISKSFKKAKMIVDLGAIIKRHNIDVIVVVDARLYVYVYPYQKLNQIRCIAWEHFNLYSSRRIKDRFLRKLAAKNSNQLIVLGKKDLNSYYKKFGKNINAQYIYNPVAVDISHEYKGCDTKRILAAGRLEKEKGFDRLVEVWNQLEKKFPEWTLDILGDGSQKKAIEDKIKEYKLKNIHLKGYSSDIKSEYDSASIFALTSRYEGFVLVLIEAQARRLPCISFDIKEGPCEIIDDGVNGFLVEDGNIEQFADKLGRLMESRDLRKHFSDMSQKDLSRFENSNVIDQWDKLLKELEQGD